MRRTWCDISRQRSVYGLEYAHQVASSLMTNLFERTAVRTVRLDFEDLPNPVPASIYFDARINDCWGKQTHCGTINDDSFRPKISLDLTIWRDLLPKDIDCPVLVLNDPPVSWVKVDEAGSENAMTPESFPQVTPQHGGPQHVNDRTYAKPASTVMLTYPLKLLCLNIQMSSGSSIGPERIPKRAILRATRLLGVTTKAVIEKIESVGPTKTNQVDRRVKVR
jgi:hypothetical protein